MEEIWKPIDQFPKYYVSNLGNIKNIITNKPLKLNCKDCEKEYTQSFTLDMSNFFV